MESLVLGVYESLPDPYRKDNVMPAFELKLMALVLVSLEIFLTKLLHGVFIKRLLISFALFFKLLASLIKLIDTIISLLILHGVLYDSQVFVEIKHTH